MTHALELCLWAIIADMIDEEQAVLEINSGIHKCYDCENPEEKICYYPLSKYLNFELLERIKRK